MGGRRWGNLMMMRTMKMKKMMMRVMSMAMGTGKGWGKVQMEELAGSPGDGAAGGEGWMPPGPGG